jgi:GNAT superfamily N-acetyltransferase
MERPATFRQAFFPDDRSAVMGVRDAVYVRELGLLSAATDLADTFDKYDPHATFFLAEDEVGPAGTVKVIRDSGIGLPCEFIADMADVTGLRARGTLAELGHLLTVPRLRGRQVGMELMRMALIYSVRACRATHITATILTDERGVMRPFYRELGFVAIGEPRPIPSFRKGQLGIAAFLDLAEAARVSRTADGEAAERLRYFFHDYPKYTGDAN